MQKKDLWQQTQTYVNAVLYDDELDNCHDVARVQILNKMRKMPDDTDFTELKVNF